MTTHTKTFYDIIDERGNVLSDGWPSLASARAARARYAIYQNPVFIKPVPLECVNATVSGSDSDFTFKIEVL